MKAFAKWIIALGILTTVSCSVVQQSVDNAERNAAERERRSKARSYSEFVQARFASLTGDPHRAANYYANAAVSNPSDRDLLERAIFTALISGDVDNAEATARHAPKDTLQRSSLPRLVIGTRDLKAGQYTRARRTLLPETSSLFNDMIARCLIAWTIAEQDSAKDALKLLNPSNVNDTLLSGMNLSTRAFIQLYAEDYDGALTTLEGIWDARIYQAVTAEYYARLLARKGEIDKAARILRQFTTRIGQNAAIEDLRADLAAGRSIDPVPLSLQQGAALSIYTPAAALAAQTRNDLSAVYFALALDLDPDLHIARTLWGDALDNADRRPEAIAILNAIPADSTFYATAQGQIAWALRREGLNDEALTTARSALAASPDRNLKIQLGDLLRSLEQFGEAEIIFNELIDADTANNSEDWRILYARGAVRQRQGRWPEAEKDLLRANQLKPNEPDILNFLGYTWVDRGENLQEGLKMIKRAAILRPNSGAVIDSLGWAYYKLGNYAEAVKHLERAVELSPRDATLNEHLGDAYWRAGRRLEASFQWNRTIRLAPESDRVKDLKSKVENGLDRTEAHSSASNRND